MVGRNEQHQVKNNKTQTCSQPASVAASQLMWKPPNVCICGVLSRSDISVANYYWEKLCLELAAGGEYWSSIDLQNLRLPSSKKAWCRARTDPGET